MNESRSEGLVITTTAPFCTVRLPGEATVLPLSVSEAPAPVTTRWPGPAPRPSTPTTVTGALTSRPGRLPRTWPAACIWIRPPVLLMNPVAMTSPCTWQLLAPRSMVPLTCSDLAVQAPVTVAVGVAEGTATSSVAVGTAPVDQFPATLQSVETAPVQVKTGAAGGHWTTAPLLAWKVPPPTSGVAPTTSIANASGVAPSRSFATRWNPPAVSEVVNTRLLKVKAVAWPTLLTVNAVPTGLWLVKVTLLKLESVPPVRTSGTPSSVRAVKPALAPTSAPPAVSVTPVPVRLGPLAPLVCARSCPVAVTLLARVRGLLPPTNSRLWKRLVAGSANDTVAGVAPPSSTRWLPLATNDAGSEVPPRPCEKARVVMLPAVSRPVSLPPLQSVESTATASPTLVMIRRPTPLAVLRIPWFASSTLPPRVTSPEMNTVPVPVTDTGPFRAAAVPPSPISTEMLAKLPRNGPAKVARKPPATPLVTWPEASTVAFMVRVRPFRLSTAPGCTTSVPIWWLLPSCGLLGVPAGITASPVMPGPPPPVQLSGFSQLLSAAPVQVWRLALKGQLMTAPFSAWLNPPSAAGVGVARSSVRMFGLAPSASVALR